MNAERMKFPSLLVLHVLTDTKDMTQRYWGYDSRVLHNHRCTEGMTHRYLGYDSRVLHIVPLEKRSREGPVGKGQIVPRVRDIVLGKVPNFIDFHIHLPTFLCQLCCFVEKVIMKRLSESFIMTGFLFLCSSFLPAKIPQEVYVTIKSWRDT